MNTAIQEFERGLERVGLLLLALAHRLCVLLQLPTHHHASRFTSSAYPLPIR
jgi:hypothetical protein